MTNAEATTTQETAAGAKTGATVAPKDDTSTKAASRKKGAPQGKKSAKKAAPEKAVKPESKPAGKKATRSDAKPVRKKAARAARSEACGGSKKQIVIDLLRRKDGATVAEIAKATSWQNHTIRGFVSGTLTQRMNLPVASFKTELGERAYRIER